MKLNIYKISTLAVTLLFSAGVFGQTPGFVQQDVVKVANITTDAGIYNLPVTQRQTTKTYYDGMGRPLQSIAVQATPNNNDIIQPAAYNNLGQQTTNYLPYGGASSDVMGRYRPNAITTDQPNFYEQTGQHLIITDANPYSSQAFENSPLQRVLSAGMAGAGFQATGSGTQHYKTISYRPSSSADGNILVWNPDGTYTTGTYYPVNSLTVTDAVDEDGVETLAFADYAGRTILKRQIISPTNLDTYYIYNNAGMVIYVVPPAATNILSTNGYNLTIAPLSNMVFNFQYDVRGRVVQKTVPGKGVVYIVYDPVNRPVLVQDANMRANNQWNYIKYDAKNHVISQGIYTDPTNNTLPLMVSYVNGLASGYASTWFETRSNNILTNGGYYTNNVFPTGTVSGTSISALAYVYYDNYDKNNNGTVDFTYVSQSLPGEETPTLAQVKGMPTIVSKTTVGSGIASNTWLTYVTFYDKRLNPIQTQSNNQAYYTSPNTITDYNTNVPDFMGVPQINKIVKQVNSSSTGTTSVQTNFTYDQVYRVTAIDQYYNNLTTVNHVAIYTYNELGQLVTKSLGNTTGSNWLQTINMRYNIRGQLLNINNATLTPDGGATDSDPHAVFGMELMYEQQDSNLGNHTYYDGKISAVKWMTGDGAGTNTNERAFRYTYDAVNRYNSEGYFERSGGTGSFNINPDGFDESAITYDLNGNLLTLKRNSSAPGGTGGTQIDNLHYTYSTTSPNQLQSVTDGLAAQYTGAGFRNLTGSTGSYSYDTNGNLTADPYKGLAIAYDFLNRTDKITITTGTGQYIDYTYSADGTLLRKRQFNGSTLQSTTDYVNGFVAITSAGGTATLSYCPMPEGRLLNNSGTLTQEFIITDQQGNARVSFQNNGGTVKVMQENSYYATGLIMASSPVSTPPVPNKKLYNGGSEWQNDYGSPGNNLPDYYQTDNRNYDAALGRFVGVDPAAENAEGMTSYEYAGNNPIMNNDPLGDIFGKPQYGNPSVNEFNQPGGWTPFYSTVFQETWGGFGNTYDDEVRDDDDGSDGGGTPTMTAQGIINIIVEFFKSPYGGYANGSGFKFYSSRDEAMQLGYLSLALQEMMNPNLASELPESATSWSDVRGRYNAIIADKHFRQMSSDALETTGPYEIDKLAGDDTYNGELKNFNIDIRPDDFKINEDFAAEEEVDGVTGTVKNFMKDMLETEAPTLLKAVSTVLGVASFVNNAREAYNAALAGHWGVAGLHFVQVAGQVGLWVSGAEGLEAAYNVGSMAIDVGTTYYEHSRKK